MVWVDLGAWVGWSMAHLAEDTPKLSLGDDGNFQVGSTLQRAGRERKGGDPGQSSWCMMAFLQMAGAWRPLTHRVQ